MKKVVKKSSVKKTAKSVSNAVKTNDSKSATRKVYIAPEVGGDGKENEVKAEIAKASKKPESKKAVETKTPDGISLEKFFEKFPYLNKTEIAKKLDLNRGTFQVATKAHAKLGSDKFEKFEKFITNLAASLTAIKLSNQ